MTTGSRGSKQSAKVIDLFGNGRRKKRKAVGKNTLLNKRLFVLILAFLGVTFLLIGRLAYYQLLPSKNEKMRSEATNQQLSDTPITAKRGTIYDSNMEVLVKSTTAWSVKLNTKKMEAEDREAIARMLCDTLELSREYIDSRLDITSNEVNIKKKADKAQRDTLAQFIDDNDLKCISMVADTRRTYARGSLASTILGFTGSDNTGLSGIENRYNDTLSGIDGRAVTAQNALGGAMSDDFNTLFDPQDGSSLVLTIDANIQACMEKYLAQAVIDNDVRNRASAIMMEVKTGAVLGMATMPDYDPSQYAVIADQKLREQLESIIDDKEREAATAKAREAQWRNKCVSDTYEPGSVFKPITMAAALEEGVTKMSDGFSCPGYKVVGGRRINCHKGSGHGSESLTKGMMNSCNVVFMTLGDRLGGTLFFKYFKAFGFTERTGIDLPGEAKTVSGVSYHTEKNLNAHSADLAVSSFGQTNVVSPIQMITAISAVCNGGYLVEPYVVDKVLDSSGNIISSHERVVKRQVISAQTSANVNKMLEATVSQGTAKNGYVAGYRIGGKTGTSEKIHETATTGIKTYVASFCAIAPSDDPEIALLVLLDDPRGSQHMGGAIAAPVARNIMSEALPYLGVETIYSTEDAKTLDTIAPSLINKTVDEAKAALKEKGLEIKIEGDGETVLGQIPQAGQSIPKGGTVVVSTTGEGIVDKVSVPNVKGLSPASANKAITNAGLNIRYSGSGYDTKQGVATKQSIPAESKVEKGTVVTVEFIMSGSTD